MIFYDIYYYLLGIILLPGIIMSIWAQAKVSNDFNKYNDLPSSNGLPANQLARKLLDGAGLTNIKVTSCKGSLTDHYNPKTETVALSEAVYDKSSISALGVMAHELGHVLQYKDKYFLIRLKSFLVPVINIFNFFMWPLVIVGIIIEAVSYTKIGFVFIIIGICIFALSTLLSLITLPIELNASKRAYTLLVKTGILTEDEGEGVKKVLNSAALTYLAGLITSILSLLRFVIYILAITRKD